ncbi:MAG: preprotein translocase subunit YajC [Planctomycetes bacterium]|nr:preprotein translocase subunit YajC [Planctomycetota bacterium]MCH8120302.1 preprotein translocase subunit YajC [Planctomycetota bacterium]
MNNVWILARAEPTEAPSAITGEPVTAEDTTTTRTVASDSNRSTQQTPPPRSPLMQYIPFILIFVVMYLILFRGPRKKQQQHKQMVQTLSKNDKVRTIGGIIGTVVDIKGDEVTLKVDESNNTKIKIASSAISRNVSKDKS